MVRLWKVSNGQWSVVDDPPIGTTANWSQPHEWYLRASENNLDLAVKVDGTWYVVFNSANSGQDKLIGGPGSGAIGLGTTGESADPVICDTFTYGYDPAGEGYVAQTVATDEFEEADLWVFPVYDEAGNLADDGIYLYDYDAWNRLVGAYRKVVNAIPSYQALAMYSYDGLGRRTRKTIFNSGNLDRTEYYYYNHNWQLLEVDQGSTPATHKAVQQFVWGTQYIDEAICMDVDIDDDGDCTDLTTTPPGARRFFYMQDANWNVVALREGTSIVERYEYDPYGTVRIYRASATSGAAEQRTVTAQSLKWLDANLSANPVLYAGYFYDSEIGTYQVRNRKQEPQLGRWIQAEPLPLSGVGPEHQYAAGMNLYEYAAGYPTGYVDWSGEAPSDPGRDMRSGGRKPNFWFCRYKFFQRLFYDHYNPSCTGSNSPDPVLCRQNIRNAAKLARNLAGRYLFGYLCYDGFDEGHGWSGQLGQIRTQLQHCGRVIPMTCCDRKPRGNVRAPAPQPQGSPQENRRWYQRLADGVTAAAGATVDAVAATGDWVWENPGKTAVVVGGAGIIVFDVLTVPSGEGAIGAAMITKALQPCPCP